jgi:predicted enzyme related to lactoylglutathione lyase
MADPLDALRAPVTPVDPGPEFTTRLRARLERALGLPEGVAVTGVDMLPREGRGTAGMPVAERGGAVPYLAVRGARDALDWYARVLGARPRGEPIIMPDGRVGHAELELADGMIYLADEHPEIGLRAPEPGGVSVSLVLRVSAVDEIAGTAVRAGASLDRGPYEAYGHRNATVIDPFGHRWMLQQPLASAGEPVTAPGGRRAGRPSPRQGDIGYASVWAGDGERAAAFYAAVLGWEYAPRQGPGSLQVPAATPPHGVLGGETRPTLFCSYVVEDAAAAVARVRAAGGEASDPVPRPYGLSADCVDTDGMRFALHQPAAPSSAAEAGSGPAAAPRDGDLVYVTLEVPDPEATLAFYGSVLGWRSHPGRAPGGWQVEDTTPMIGVSGGHAVATGVPVWHVADVTAAVARVRAAGGTSTEPHREPYGLIAECADDQGTRFSLMRPPA